MTMWARIRRLIRYRLGLPPTLSEHELFGQDLMVREGTIRAKPDYDDAWVVACASHANVVFDVEANVGYDALLMLYASTTLRELIAIEANTDALVVCAENLLRNGLGVYTRFVNAFASDQDGEQVQFWTVGVGAAGSLYGGHAETAFRTGQSRRVPTTTCDVLAERYGLIPDFVKIDVEGAEVSVLQGSVRIGERQQTRFLVEMHSNPDLTMLNNAEQMLSWCRQVGYSAWYLAEASRLEAADAIAHRGRCHLLLQPEKWTYPAWLQSIRQSAPLEIVR